MSKLKLYSPGPLLRLQICVSILLSVYVFIFLIPPGLVPHSEHDHLGQLDSALETDPCHIAMYHPGVAGGCHHKYHLSINHGDCPLCHITLVRQITVDPLYGTELVHAIIPFEIYFPEISLVSFPITHDDRGPPSSGII